MAKAPALTEVTKIGNITVDGEGRIGVETHNFIMRGDQVVAGPTLHRKILEPGQDLTDEDPKVVAIAQVTWTEEVVEAFKAMMAEIEKKMPFSAPAPDAPTEEPSK